MASIGKAFNPQEHDTEQRGDFPNLPDGDYVLEVSAADVKITNPDSPRERKMAINCTMDVIEPEELKGRKLFVNYNMENPSEQAQKIGQAQFASLCRALEITDPVEDTDDIMFKSFSAKIGMGKDSKEKNADGSPKYAARNEIKRYYYPDEGAVPEAKAAPQPANDNRPAANDNRSSAPAARPQAATGGAAPAKRPWGSSKG